MARRIRRSHRPLTKTERRLIRVAASRQLRFEPLEARRLLNRDYGDAPLPYPVLLDEGLDAARHVAVGPQLGAARDVENDGLPSPNADGDGADDDGVTFGELQAGTAAATAFVNVSNAPDGAKLDAWIDFNGDGNWGGQHERVAFAAPVVEGDNVVTFSIPSWANSGETFARFRLSTAGGLGIAGDAPDGEVEDYAVTIAPPRKSAGLFSGSPTLVDPAAENVWEISSADLDLDGDWDVVSVRSELDSAAGSAIVWHENLSDGSFITHVIDDTLIEPRNLELSDIDGDGRVDLLVATHDPGNLYWFENDGGGTFTRRSIGQLGEVPRDIHAVDLDRDGDIDVVTTSTHNGGLQFFQNNGSQGFADLTIEANHTYSGDSDVADLNRNGLLEVFASSNLSPDRVGRHEYIGAGIFISNFVNSNLGSITDIRLADLDDDGDIDALAADFSVGQFYLYENHGAASFGRHTFAVGTRATNISVADLDGDGDLDVLTNHIPDSTSQPGRVEWYENDGELVFTKRVLDDSVDWPIKIWPTDIDNDGDLDILVADPVAEKIVWYENAATVGVVVDRATIDEETLDSAILTLTRGGDAGGELVVEFAVAGDANWIDDFTVRGADGFDGSAGTVTFAAGVDTVEIVVTAVEDDDVEPPETLGLEVTPPEGYAVDGSATASITIESGDFLGDYGDAPANYKTLFINDGARHLAVGPTLGATRDEELDGVPSPSADGDGGDEDGVTFGELRAGDVSASLTVDVGNAPAGAMLDAWIDFNGDGSWNGAGERIADALPVVEGANELTIAVPADAVSGTTYSRLRLSTAGGLTTHGAADDGEVEDYAVAILSPVASGGAFLDRRLIDAQVNGPESLDSADFDGDGDLDLVAAVGNVDEVVWFENLPGDHWATHVIATNFDRVHAVIATDIDGDGDADVVAAPTNDNIGQFFLYENTPGGAFVEHLLPFSNVEVDEFATGDFDGDGDIDLAAADAGGLRVELYRNDGNENFTVESTVGEFDGVAGIDAFDLDRDGDLDLVAASHGGSFASTTNQNLVAWLENDGAGQFTLHTIDDSHIDARDAAGADFDNDGDIDVVATFDDKIRWYENDGSEEFTLHEVDDEFANYRRVRTADLDGDGEQDFVAAVGSLDAAWFENDGAGAFTRRVLPSPGGGMGDILPGDLDNDGDLDLAFGTTFADTVAWYEAVAAVDVAVSPTVVSEAGNGATTFTFTRSGNLAAPLTVSFHVAGAALFEFDYTVAGATNYSVDVGTIEFTAGESTATITVTPIDDALTELDEPIVITLIDGDEYRAGVNRQAMAVITSDEFGGDLGDAPGPYPTLLVDNGAGHQPIGPRLGPTRTVETDGQPSPQADADTDDGVTFGAMSIGQLDAEVTVDVQNAPLGARVDAWIDFNGDGHWGGAGERIVTSALVAPGVNTLQFAVPVDAAAGTRIARLRLSTQGNLGPTGVAGDGEVEDYAVDILAAAGGDGVFIDRGGLLPAVENLEIVVPVDLDGDGDLDLLTPTRNGFTWFENQGSYPFIEHPVQAAGLNNFPNDILAADFNGDGLLDVALVSRFDDRILWFEQSTGGAFAVRDEAFINNASEIVAVDFDVDGDQDLISLSEFNGAVFLHENRLGGQFDSTEFASFGAFTEELNVSDVDGDGDLDLAGVVRGQVGGVVWLESQPGGFTEHALPAGGFDDFQMLVVADLDSDGDRDFIAGDVRQTEANLVWWEQISPAQFELRQVSNAQGFLRALRAADIDADGDVDLLTFGRGTSNFFEAIVLYENDGSQNFAARDAAIASRGRSFELADVDQDGDLDIITAHIRSDSNIQWHEQITADEGDFDNDGGVVGGDFLAWQRGFDATHNARDLAAWEATFGFGTEPSAEGDDEDLAAWEAAFGVFAETDDLAFETSAVESTATSSYLGPPLLDGMFEPLSKANVRPVDEANFAEHLAQGAETARQRVFARYAPQRRNVFADFDDADFGDIVVRRTGKQAQPDENDSHIGGSRARIR